MITPISLHSLDDLYKLGDIAFEVVADLRKKDWGCLSEGDVMMEAGYMIMEKMK